MKIRFSAGASRQLEAILAYIATENPIAADGLAARIEAVTGFLADKPYAGRRFQKSA
jgi:plasmid stabilization system protein ParE